VRDELLRLLPALRRFARGLAGNLDEADDLVQSACERAIRNIRQWRPGTRLDSWLYRIIQTTWIDQRRAQGVRDRHALGVAATAEIGGGGEATAIDKLTLKAVDVALDQLPEAQRAVLLLVCVEQLSYAEAGEILQVPVGTVMSRLSRARLALRHLVPDGENNRAAMSAADRMAAK